MEFKIYMYFVNCWSLVAKEKYIEDNDHTKLNAQHVIHYHRSKAAQVYIVHQAFPAGTFLIIVIKLREQQCLAHPYALFIHIPQIGIPVYLLYYCCCSWESRPWKGK